MGQKMGHFRASEGPPGTLTAAVARYRVGPHRTAGSVPPGCLPSVGWKAAAGVTLVSTHGTGVVPKVRLGVTPLPYHRRRGRE